MNCQLVGFDWQELGFHQGDRTHMDGDQRRLVRLCDQAIYERDQFKVKRLLDEILRLLAANQKGQPERGPKLVTKSG